METAVVQDTQIRTVTDLGPFASHHGAIGLLSLLSGSPIRPA